MGVSLTRSYLRQELSQSAESSESKSRRLLFDRVRQSLSDLMMTADEKNHVISNANDELDRQIVRLDAVFPYIAGEISEEARLGSLTHWAYSNKSTAKAATNERPRREAVAQRQDLTHVLQEAEAASRSEARRDAVLARKQRRAQVDADYEDTRSSGTRKTNNAKSRGGDQDPNAAPKRRKVERPPVDTSIPMERSASGAGSQRAANKDPAEKKRSRAPNATAAARKKYVLFRYVQSCIQLTSSQGEHFQCCIASFGPVAFGRNIQCPAWCCQSRTQLGKTAVFTNPAEFWSDKQCARTAVIICFKPSQQQYAISTTSLRLLC